MNSEKIKGSDIDSLDSILKIVSPELILEYERKHFHGESLAAKNEQYKNAQRTLLSSGAWLKWWFALLIPIVMLTVLTPITWLDVALFLICSAIGILMVWRDDKKTKKSRESQSMLSIDLEQFRKAMEGLNPVLVFAHPRSISLLSKAFAATTEGVKNRLVNLAMNIIREEDKLDHIRSSKQRRIAEMRSSLDEIALRESLFDKTFESAIAFGIVTKQDKGSFFDKAKAKFEKEDAPHV